MKRVLGVLFFLGSLMLNAGCASAACIPGNDAEAIGVIGASNDGYWDHGQVANPLRFGDPRTVDAINFEIMGLSIDCLARGVAIPGSSSTSFRDQYFELSPYVDYLLIGQTGRIYGGAAGVIRDVSEIIRLAEADGIVPMLSLYPTLILGGNPPPAQAIADYNDWALGTGLVTMQWPVYRPTEDGLHADQFSLKLAAKALILEMTHRGYLLAAPNY